MSLYEFVDVNDTPLYGKPAEALSINGNYIEDQIEGYRTLYVSGREALSPSLDTFEVTSRDGSVLRSRRYPARTITIGYQLVSGSSADYRSAYNKLAGILNTEDAKLIFEDEKDKYFIGTPSEIGEVEKGRNAVTGEFSILCLDPLKYAIEETEAEMQTTGGQYAFDYDGSYKAAPKITVTAKSDLGYFGLVDDSGHSVQVGDPEETTSSSSHTFSKGDVIVADFSTGTITKNGTATPSLGAIGNDWDTLRVVPGTNRLNALWSSWATAPDFKLTYRKAYL